MAILGSYVRFRGCNCRKLGVSYPKDPCTPDLIDLFFPQRFDSALDAADALGKAQIFDTQESDGKIFSSFRKQKKNNTLQGTNMSHLGKRKIIFKSAFFGAYVSSHEGRTF